MNNSFGESKMFEQVNSRATKPDESRKKSLYFLLLAVGRQRAAANPSLRVVYRHALNSLQIYRLEDYWKIELEFGGKVISKEVKRNSFKFYSTGLNQREDTVVQSNTTAAHEFWKSLESDLVDIPIRESRENLKVATARFFFNNMRTTDVFTFVIIFLVIAPYLPKTITFLTLLLFPTLILIYGGVPRIVTFSYTLLLAILGTVLDVETFQNISSNNLSLHLLFFLVAWQEFYRVKLQRNSRSLYSVANLVLLLGLSILSLSTISNDLSYLLLVFLALLSEIMRKVRKFFIEKNTLVIVSVISEIAVCLLMCTYLFKSSLAIKEPSVITLILLSSIYLVWFIYFNVNERFTISLRFFFPTVILSASDIHSLKLVEFIAAFIVVFMIFVNSILQRSGRIR